MPSRWLTFRLPEHLNSTKIKENFPMEMCFYFQTSTIATCNFYTNENFFKKELIGEIIILAD